MGGETKIVADATTDVVNNKVQSTTIVTREHVVSTIIYQLKILYGLIKDDPDRRMHFCELMSKRLMKIELF